MKESNKGVSFTSLILLILIICIIFIVLSYKYQKYDKFKIFHKGDIDHIETQINTPNHVDEVHSQIYSEAERVFNENGVPDLTDLLVTEINAEDVADVQVKDDSGEMVTVPICNNSTMRQPVPINNALICMNSLKLVETEGIWCCDTPDDLEEGHEGLLGRMMATGGQMFNAQPIASTSAVLFSMYAMNGFPGGKKLAQTVGKGGQKLLPKFATSYAKAVTNRLGTSLIKAGSGKMVGTKLLKAIVSGKELLGKLVSFTYRKTGARSIVRGVVTRAQGARRTVGRAVARRAFTVAAERGVESGAGRVAMFIGEKAAQYAAVGAAGAVLGPLVLVVDVVMMVEMVLEMLDFVLNQLDVGGFGQFQSMETIKNTMKDPNEILHINHHKNMGLDPPFIFTLDDLWVLGNLEEITHFNDILNNYIGAIQAYMANLNRNLDKYLSQADKIIIRSALESEIEITENYLMSICPKLSDRPEERDKFIWNYLTEHLSGDSLSYIEYQSELTSENVIAVTLNEKGVNSFNENVEKQREPEIGFPDKLKYTKFYRDLNESKELVQKALPVKTAIIKSIFEDVIEHFCTEGMDPEEIAEKFPLRNSLCCAAWCNDDPIRPKDYGVTYNVDRGLCEYTKEYCEHMGYSDIEEDNVKCEDSGCEASTYKKCKLSEGQEALSLGGVMPEAVVHEWARNPAAVVGGAAVAVGTVTALTLTAPISIPGAILATSGGAAAAGAAAAGSAYAGCAIQEAM